MDIAATVPSRRRLAWGLAFTGLLGSLLGWAGLYAVAATVAAGTQWWVGVGFLLSGPIALAGVINSSKKPRLGGAWFVSCLALFVFLVLWILLLIMKFA